MKQLCEAMQSVRGYGSVSKMLECSRRRCYEEQREQRCLNLGRIQQKKTQPCRRVLRKPLPPLPQTSPNSKLRIAIAPVLDQYNIIAHLSTYSLDALKDVRGAKLAHPFYHCERSICERAMRLADEGKKLLITVTVPSAPASPVVPGRALDTPGRRRRDR